jgi:hypothetical protein
MPTKSVHALSRGYEQNIAELYQHLSKRERNCLHVIYERLRVAEDVLDSFERDYVSTVREKMVDDPNEVYASRLSEIYESYDLIDKLIDSYLQSRPIDVFYIDEADGTVQDKNQNSGYS